MQMTNKNGFKKSVLPGLEDGDTFRSTGMQNSLKAIQVCAQGKLSSREGNTDEALNLFNRATELDPGLSNAWFNKGVVFTQSARWKEAIASFKKGVESNPKSIECWNGMGYAMRADGQFKEAIEAYKNAIALDHMFAYPWNGIGGIRMAMGEFEEAIECFGRAIEIDNTYADPWIGRAFVIKCSPDFEETIGISGRDCLCRALFLRQQYVQAFPLALSSIQELTEYYDMSLTSMKILEETDAIYESGQLEFRHSVEVACHELTEILTRIDSDIEIGKLDKLLLSGMIRYYHGDPVGAFDCFNDVDNEDEKNLQGQYYLLLTMKQCREPSAKELTFALRQVLDFQEEANSKTVEQFYYAGLIFMFAGRVKEAEQCFRNNNGHLPSLCMLWECCRSHNKDEYGENKDSELILNQIIECDKVFSEENDSRSWLAGIPFAINATLNNWLINLKFYINAKELESVIFAIKQQQSICG